MLDREFDQMQHCSQLSPEKELKLYENAKVKEYISVRKKYFQVVQDVQGASKLRPKELEDLRARFHSMCEYFLKESTQRLILKIDVVLWELRHFDPLVGSKITVEQAYVLKVFNELLQYLYQHPLLHFS